MKESIIIEEVLRTGGNGSHRAGDSGCVLVMVLATAGSTYQKAGSVALVASGRVIAGMVSGGCLEADLALRTASLLTAPAGSWFPLRYDTRLDEDDVFGSALGCRGCLDLALIPWPCELLQQVLFDAWSSAETRFGIVSLGPDGTLAFKLAPMASFSSDAADSVTDVSLKLPLGQDSSPWTSEWKAMGYMSSLAPPKDSLRIALPKRRHVLVLGCGADAWPLIGMLCDLGVEVTAVDHRPDALDSLACVLDGRLLNEDHFLGPDSIRAVAAGRLVRRLAAKDFLISCKDLCSRAAGVLVMSHNLEWDSRYLEALRFVDPRQCYVGLLGPAARRREVFARLAPEHPLDVSALHSPMGLAMQDRGPAAIALGVIAEMFQAKI